MRRRDLPGGVAALATCSVAGCASTSTPGRPGSATVPETLLPPEGDGWQSEQQAEWDASQLHENADSAVDARYSGPDGGSYRVVIVQWGDDPADVGRETAGDAVEGSVRALVRAGSVTPVATSVEGGNVDGLLERSETSRT